MKKPRREPEAAARAGTVYLVGAGPGDPELLTLRGLELLESADAVLHDELVAPLLVRRARADALVEYVGKRGSEPASKQKRQSEIDERLVEHKIYIREHGQDMPEISGWRWAMARGGSAGGSTEADNV